MYTDHESPPSRESTSKEISFWIGGAEKWISGVTLMTTCGDIVEALMKSDTKYSHYTDILSKYVLVERWRKVEKPLKSDSKILKIYQAWGREISDVKFVVKRLHISKPEYSSRSHRVRRTDSKVWRQNQIGCTTDTIHPKCLSESEDEKNRNLPPKVEKLMKSILVQGASIQAQLLKLSAKSTIEGEQGKDYLLQQYLSSIPEGDEANPDSGCTSGTEEKLKTPQKQLKVTGLNTSLDSGDISFVGGCSEETSFPESGGEPSIKLWTELFEKLFTMNQKLEIQEEELTKLSNNMSSYLSPESFVESEIKSASEELAGITDLNTELGREIRRNELALGNMVQNYDGRKSFADSLELDVNRAESNSLKLKKEISERISTTKALIHPEKSVRFDDRETIFTTPEPPESYKPASSVNSSKKSILKSVEGHVEDSNSDTGLSSMHSSSSDDGSSPVTSFGLDTLV